MKEIFPILPFKVTEKIDMKFKISLKIHAFEYIMYVIFFHIENGINPVFFRFSLRRFFQSSVLEGKNNNQTFN